MRQRRSRVLPALALALGGLGMLCVPGAAALAKSTTVVPPTKPKKALPPEIPAHSILFNSMTAVLWNPLGAETRLRVGYRLRLYSSESILLRNSYARLDFETRLNPAFARVGARVTVQPLAILRLWARYEIRGYFGTFRQLQSFPTAQAIFDDDTLQTRSDQDLNYTPHGHEITLGAMLRGRVGPIAVVNDLRVMYYKMDLQDGDRVWYDIGLDNVLPGDGWALVNNVMALWISRFGLFAGARYSVIAAFYTDAQLGGGDNLNTPTHRLGPLVGYRFKSKSKWFRQPTLMVNVSWWFNSRFRSGGAVGVSQAIPTGFVAFRFNGDIWHR